MLRYMVNMLSDTHIEKESLFIVNYNFYTHF